MTWEIKAIIRDLTDCLTFTDKFEVQKSIYYAEKPAIKATHIPTGTRVDLSFTDGLGVRHTKILDHWLNLQGDEARKLCLFVRKWFEMWNFGRHFHKMLDLLVVYFLQWEGFLPSYSKVRDCAERPLFIRNVNSSFNRDLSDSIEYDLDHMNNYRDHIKDFFRFYKDFDFTQNVICPYVGNNYMVDRDELLSDEDMLEELSEFT
jgi:hypothetical protein